jgi:hypothetical protein
VQAPIEIEAIDRVPVALPVGVGETAPERSTGMKTNEVETFRSVNDQAHDLLGRWKAAAAFVHGRLGAI